jgi:Fe-S cluster biogenesis protein NfuA
MKPSSELIDRVEDALNSIRPYLEADGGNVKIIGISEGNVVKLELIGACGTCPMSTMTMKAGVEEAIKRAVPEITSVEATNLTEGQLL